ncbi:MAG: hypothetical protein PUB21_05860 [Bacteroidales bacterium]|nr:hypothetical protein [Bacteroidales bacterium]
MERFDIIEKLRRFRHEKYRVVFEEELFSFWNKQGNQDLYIHYDNVLDILISEKYIQLFLKNGIIHHLSLRTGEIVTLYMDEEDMNEFHSHLLSLVN